MYIICEGIVPGSALIWLEFAVTQKPFLGCEVSRAKPNDDGAEVGVESATYRGSSKPEFQLHPFSDSPNCFP